MASPRCVGFLPREVSRELIYSEFTLEEPLDTFGVHDGRVSNSVSPVRKSDQPGSGQRRPVGRRQPALSGVGTGGGRWGSS